MTADLASFLAGRLDEAQATAQAVLDAAQLFPAEPSRHTPLGHQAFDGSGIITMHDHTVVLPSDVARHIAANDPARTLRRIAGQRAILADCTARLRYPANAPLYNLAVRTLRNLAAEWADHPDYPQEQEVPAKTSPAVLTSGDPQPPPGTLVRDDCGIEWRHDGQGGYWLRTDNPAGDPESWAKIAGNYGPVTVLQEA